ncbi:RNA polymerase sigma factor SigJ [Pseudonocardia sp. CA-107938]|uniref:RNA polymerase sigma factor SigJ n=1 Tax=Pseudonocardia sp. CA-107938 TaxID=3240021 RepID=UPI003D8A5F80
MADLFEAERPALFGLAYRMLGTRVDAEDVLQDAWLRWSRVDQAGVEDPRAYLFRLVTNTAVDQLRRLQARRETYVGPWLPEPLVGDAAQEVETRAAASVGLLVVLESLDPDERAVFVLHEAFGFGHSEIAAMLGRTDRAVRQLAYRARRHVRDRRPRREPHPQEHRELVARFADAAVRGDVAALVALLAPDAVFVADSAGRRETPRTPLHTAAAIADWFRSAQPFWPADLGLHVVTVNGEPGLLVTTGGTPFLVAALEVADARIHAIHAQLSGEKLALVARA